MSMSIICLYPVCSLTLLVIAFGNKPTNQTCLDICLINRLFLGDGLSNKKRVKHCYNKT